MDIEKFIREDLAPSDRIGIYCVRQQGLKPPFNRMYRCGAAGTKEIVDTGYGKNQMSSFKSRLAMYLSNWITGGFLFYALTVSRSVFSDFSEKLLEKSIDPRDARPPKLLCSCTNSVNDFPSRCASAMPSNNSSSPARFP